MTAAARLQQKGDCSIISAMKRTARQAVAFKEGIVSGITQHVTGTGQGSRRDGTILQKTYHYSFLDSIDRSQQMRHCYPTQEAVSP
jgi:hypothetical protein